jgi:hypothetical protein
VVDGVDEPTCDELRVDEEARCATALPFCLFVSLRIRWSFFPFILGVLRLLLLCSLCRKEGMTGGTAAVEWLTIYAVIGENERWSAIDSWPLVSKWCR